MIVSHPGARTDPETTGASFPIAIPILGGARTSSKAWSKAYKSEADDPRIHQEIHKFLFMACTSLYKPQKLVK